MPVRVDIEEIRNLMQAKQMDISSLAARAGMSRQGLYRFLRPDYNPISKGFVSMAQALGVNATHLIKDDDNQADIWRYVTRLLQDATQGEARAFEVLPAHLLRALKEGFPKIDLPSTTHCQLAVAAAEIAHSFKPHPTLERFISQHGVFSSPGRAFFFASELMSPERIVATTPEPMKRHLVFGSFDMTDFKRHMGPC
jgi:transcriptional regulator with XRE-family HTH domain